MINALNRVGAGLFLLALAAPTVQSTFHPFPLARLTGVEVEAPVPVWRGSSWFSGEFQSAYERRLNATIGFRSYFVRTHNHLYVSLFRRQPPGAGTRIVIGKDRWLYEADYVRTYNRDADPGDDKRRRVLAEVKRLQDELRSRGIAFLVVLAPTKVEIYPEYLPDGVLLPNREARRTEYDRLRPLLDEYGIDHIDAHRLFQEKKTSQPHPLFAKGGTHWNHYGAGMVVERILEALGRASGKDVPRLTCASVRVDRRPLRADNDLGDLLNIWFAGAIFGPQVHPVFRVTGGADRPNVLMVGDSFVFTLADILNGEKLCARCDIYYYFKRHYTADNLETGEPIDRAAVDWEADILPRDAVIVEINERWLPNIGFGFVEAALSSLPTAAPAGGKSTAGPGVSSGPALSGDGSSSP